MPRFSFVAPNTLSGGQSSTQPRFSFAKQAQPSTQPYPTLQYPQSSGGLSTTSLLSTIGGLGRSGISLLQPQPSSALSMLGAGLGMLGGGAQLAGSFTNTNVSPTSRILSGMGGATSLLSNAIRLAPETAASLLPGVSLSYPSTGGAVAGGVLPTALSAIGPMLGIAGQVTRPQGPNPISMPALISSLFLPAPIGPIVGLLGALGGGLFDFFGGPDIPTPTAQERSWAEAQAGQQALSANLTNPATDTLDEILALINQGWTPYRQVRIAARPPSLVGPGGVLQPGVYVDPGEAGPSDVIRNFTQADLLNPEVLNTLEARFGEVGKTDLWEGPTKDLLEALYRAMPASQYPTQNAVLAARLDVLRKEFNKRELQGEYNTALREMAQSGNYYNYQALVKELQTRGYGSGLGALTPGEVATLLPNLQTPNIPLSLEAFNEGMMINSPLMTYA